MSNRAVVYRTASNYEGKACRELQRLGINAIAPWDESGKRAKVTAPGYIFAQREVTNAFIKHVKNKVGLASVADVARLYVMKPKRRVETDFNPFKSGQPAYRGEIAVTVASTSGRFCLIEWDMLGKRQSQSIHYTQLRPG